MVQKGRIDRWLIDLDAIFDDAEKLVGRGKAAFDQDIALQLAFEALASRVGEMSKRLVAADPDEFSHHLWSAAARHRDFVVHHYDRVDPDALWATVERDCPRLRAELRASTWWRR